MLTVLLNSLSCLCCRFSRRSVLAVANYVAGVLYFVYRLSPYRQTIYQNIQTALNLPPSQAHALAKQHIHHLVFSLADFLRFPRWQSQILPASEVQIRGWHHFQRAYRQERGVILVSAHFGFWELIPAVIGLSGLPIHTLVQKPSNPAIDQFFRKFRSLTGVQTHNNDHLSGLRPVLRALKRGEVVGLVIDQHGESNQLWGSFFKQRVSLPEGPIFFGRHCQSLIVPVFTYRQGERHIVEFFPGQTLPSAITDQGLAFMQKLYDQIEIMIRRYPQEWLWSYNRWDKCPPVPLSS